MRMKLAISGVVLAMVLSAVPALGQPPTTVGPEEQKVYAAVLDAWFGDEPTEQMIGDTLSAAPSPSDRGIADCFQGAKFSAAKRGGPSLRSLAGVSFTRPGMKVVDSKAWAPRDPAQTMARDGVDKAVADAFAHSLFSFSEITFSDDRKMAVVNYGMSCGMLCGSGATVQVRKTGERWVRTKQCGGYIS